MTQIVLPARADAASAVELRARILDTDPSARIFIDAHEVTSLSTPAAMVLLSARTRPGGLVLRRPSEAMIEAFSTLGLFAQMMTMEMQA